MTFEEATSAQHDQLSDEPVAASEKNIVINLADVMAGVDDFDLGDSDEEEENDQKEESQGSIGEKDVVFLLCAI